MLYLMTCIIYIFYGIFCLRVRAIFFTHKKFVCNFFSWLTLVTKNIKKYVKSNEESEMVFLQKMPQIEVLRGFFRISVRFLCIVKSIKVSIY